MRRSPVASGSPDLLNVLLQRAGGLVMYDVANVRLVDHHAEGARRDHDQASRGLHEPTLGRGPIGSAHLAMIPHHPDARPLEGARELIDCGSSGAVDDANQGVGGTAARLLGRARAFFERDVLARKSAIPFT